MEEEINRKENIREAMIVRYETTGKIVYRSEKKSYEIENEGIARQLSDLQVSHSATIMVPVELIKDENNMHRLGQLILYRNNGVIAREREASSKGDSNQDEMKIRIEWKNNTKDLLFTLRDFYKDQFPFGFDAFGIADITFGPHGFTLFYSNRIGKFYINNENLRREGGGIHLFLRGIVDAPLSIPILEFIKQQPTAKSVKIVKQKDVVFKGVLFLGWHKNKSSGEEKWIGWNDHIGIPKFTAKCSRNILKKNSDWDSRLTFAAFSSFFNPVSGVWRITELSYSNVDIARTEEQIPCSLFIIDDLLFEGVRQDEGMFVSRDCKRHDGSPLRVAVKDENCVFNPNSLKEEYAAIVCPLFSEGGLVVSFRALALFSRDEWLNDPRKKELTRLFYTWAAGRHLSDKIAEYEQPKIKV